GQPLHPRLPAGRATVVTDDRPGAVLRQPPLDLPHQLLALLLVSLGRLLFDQLVYFGAAVTAKVQFATAPVELMQILIRVGPALSAGDAYDVVFAHVLGKSIG